MKTFKYTVVGIVALLLIASCSVVRPGEIGFRQTLGKIHGKTVLAGSMWYNPFVTKIVNINIRTVESFQVLPLPTKEGLSVNAEISLLYHVKPSEAGNVYRKFGVNYEEVIVLSNFRATAREISARFYAKDLYATERQKVELAIADELRLHIEQHGFVVDAVLLKDIILPKQIVQSIESKVEAEQDALKMEFIIQKQKKEAERMMIEAMAIKAAQDTISSSLSDRIIEYNRIKMYESLMNSPNSKIIITNGQPIINSVQTDK
jgi:prohibitin 1